ncbi:MAG: 30S ribosomal protein S15 [Lachnospiraceae bacterium]|nr:30S ribosomal protein S15 [Lachnospiraceae bacterium]
MLSKEKKAEIVSKFGKNGNDTGSTEVQVALLTERIAELNTHLAKNPKDFHSNRGLLMMVGKRKQLLKYLETTNLDAYRDLIKKLNLRK